MFKAVGANGRVWKTSSNQRKLLYGAFKRFWNDGVFFFVDTNTETFVKYVLFRRPRGEFWEIVQRDFWLNNNDDLFNWKGKKV